MKKRGIRRKVPIQSNNLEQIQNVSNANINVNNSNSACGRRRRASSSRSGASTASYSSQSGKQDGDTLPVVPSSLDVDLDIELDIDLENYKFENSNNSNLNDDHQQAHEDQENMTDLDGSGSGSSNDESGSGSELSGSGSDEDENDDDGEEHDHDHLEPNLSGREKFSYFTPNETIKQMEELKQLNEQVESIRTSQAKDLSAITAQIKGMEISGQNQVNHPLRSSANYNGPTQMATISNGNTTVSLNKRKHLGTISVPNYGPATPVIDQPVSSSGSEEMALAGRTLLGAASEVLFGDTMGTGKFNIGIKKNGSASAPGRKHPNSSKLSPKSNKTSFSSMSGRSAGPGHSNFQGSSLSMTVNLNSLSSGSNANPVQSQNVTTNAIGHPPVGFDPNGNPMDHQQTMQALRAGFEKLKYMMKSDSLQVQFEATKGFRQMLSLKRDAICQDIINRDIVPQLITFLKSNLNQANANQNAASNIYPMLQVEALWALTNVAASPPPIAPEKGNSQAQVLVRHGAVPVLVDLLKTRNTDVLEQTVWVLGSIAADDVTSRDLVIKSGALPLILSWINTSLDLNSLAEQYHQFGTNQSHHANNSNPFNAQPNACKDPCCNSIAGFETPPTGQYPEYSVGDLHLTGDLSKDAMMAEAALAAKYTPEQLAQMTQQMEQQLAQAQRYLPNQRNFLKIASWALSNLCDGQPRPKLEITNILTTIKGILLTVNDAEVLSHVCWALSHLCDGSSTYIENVVRSQICVKLVQLLTSKAWRVVKPALRTVGNIVCAEDDQDYTQHIIDCGAIPYLTDLIKHPHKEIQKEACWTISNISAGTIDQIQKVLDSGGIPDLVKLASNIPIALNTSKAGTGEVISNEVDADVRIEACWVLLNATSCGSDKQIIQLVKEGCVQVLCSLLNDASMVMMALEGIEKVLQVGQELARQNSKGISGLDSLVNPHALLLDTERIEKLQDHRSPAIAKRASKIWKNHFVVCAICKRAYSRHINVAEFCQECKCYVCSKCNCKVYHLSYQDKLWSELIEDEEKKGKGNDKSSKSKNQKKKEKDKKKKMQQKERELNKLKPQVPEPQQPKVIGNINVLTNVNVKKITGNGVLKVDEVEDKVKQLTMQETPKKNDQYVNFLMQNGSILDLWNMMDEADDGNASDAKHEIDSLVV